MNRRTLSFKYRKSMVWTSILALMMLVLAACQPAAAPAAPAAPTNTSAPAPTATTAATMAPTGTTAAAAAAAATEPVVSVVNDAKLGQILVDEKGMTLYAFTKDGPDKSNCSAGCLKAWPPLLSQGSPKAGNGVDASKLGTTAMADGTKIVTYNQMPLYYWAKDSKPGDTTGQGVNNVWYVVSPDGQMVKSAPSVPATGGNGSSSAPSGAAMLNVANDSKLGKILVDGKGMTLYMFKKDTPNQSNCTGGCMKAWPPFLTQGTPTAGDGVNAALIGTATLADGTKIVTYNQMPLYYWAGDTKPGDTSGQGVNNVWYVVSPDGKPMVEAGGSSESGSQSSGAVSSDVVVNVANNPQLGNILVDSKGMTLYIFTKDGPNQSNCTGGCLKAWPPLVSQGSPKAGDGVNASLLGTATLADGSKIVTYNKMPLYYWAKDSKAGDATGQGVGGVWYVVSPDGKPVGMNSSSSNGSSSGSSNSTGPKY